MLLFQSIAIRDIAHVAILFIYSPLQKHSIAMVKKPEPQSCPGLRRRGDRRPDKGRRRVAR
jgi:hypothetical protein